MRRSTSLWTLLLALLAACEAPEAPEAGGTVLTGIRLWDGSGAAVVEDAVLHIRDGRVIAAGPAGEIEVPADAEVVDLSGRTVVPGMINSHGHVGGTRSLETGDLTRENLERQLRLYAAYGVTTVNSLGGDPRESYALRDENDTPGLGRARLFIAGPVISDTTARRAVLATELNADMGVDWIKIRVDDNLGTARKLPRGTVERIIEAAHQRGLGLAAHLFYLEDAKHLLRSGADFLVHSIRDAPVDDEVIALFEETGACYSPTLAREVTTFVYSERPDFFDDPFFLLHADTVAMQGLLDPDRMESIRASPAAAAYREGLEVAKGNLGALATAGVTIAMGTDTGPPGRFQGYYEHVELELMAESGMSPEAILLSATRDAAECIRRDDIGVLEPGRWADFVVLTDDPLVDVRNMRSIESVWIGGAPVG